MYPCVHDSNPVESRSISPLCVLRVEPAAGSWNLCLRIIRLLPNQHQVDRTEATRPPSTYSTSMTIVIDSSITKGQGSRQSSPPPSQPPPSYAESAATQPLLVQPGTSSVVFVPNAQAGYGPTPISQQQQAALPYYDPRSVHSIQAAERRAKERFVGAVLWVILILSLLPVLFWMDMRIGSGWSASYCAMLWIEPHQPPRFPSRFRRLLNACYLGLLVVSRSTYFSSKCGLYLLNKRRSAHHIISVLDHKNGLFQGNHSERVVDDTDDRAEFSRHTLFFLPALLVPYDGSNHDHVPLPVWLVCPLMLWVYPHWLLQHPDLYRMIVADDDLQGSGWRPTIITVFSDSHLYVPSPVGPFAFHSLYGQTMDLETPNLGLHGTP